MFYSLDPRVHVSFLPSLVYAASFYQDLQESFNTQRPSWNSLAEYKRDMMDRTLEITYNLYKRIIVEYNGYQKELLRIDNAAVKTAFEYFDDDGNGVVTKKGMMIFTERDIEKRSLKTDVIATKEGF